MTHNNFDEMTSKALLNVNETLAENSKEQERSNPYKLTQDLIKCGFMFDNNGVYVPFKESFQTAGVDMDNETFQTMENIYLFITRNPDKKLEINFKWAHKTPDGFVKSRGFNIDFLLDIGEEKDFKTLNKKLSFSGRKNHNPSSKGTYVEFSEYLTDIISETPCLEVFKEKDYIFPEIVEDEDTPADVQHAAPQSFNEYPEKVQREALEILEDGDMFEEIQTSIALTHEGHETTRDALILMESSVFVDDGAHGLLGGNSGEGKTDLALTCALNFPAKNVHIISSNSPKDIYYDFESYDDEYNILIFDDILMTEELIKLIKLLADNKVKEKVHKTVINGKAEKFVLKGKYEVILTYAKTIPDEELANRLFNIGVNIVDKGESKGKVKRRILQNRIIRADDNPLIKEIRAPIQAGVQYLIEQKARVYNPYLSVFNPLNINNRDINHLTSMTNARTFFALNKRDTIKLNDDTVLTIGSLEDLSFVHDIWARDEEAQMFKLSELQKQCLSLLPAMTDKQAFDYVEDLNEDLKNAESRAYKKKRLDDEPLLKSLAKKLRVNPSTLKHALDRFSEGNQKSLLEIGLVEKIQLDEDNPKSANFYYKVKHDGESSNHSNEHVQDVQIEFAYTFDSSIVKQMIIIDLLLYANVIVSKRGRHALEKYCSEDNVELNADNYNDMINFLQGFFDKHNNDEHFIEFQDSSRDDKLRMLNYKRELVESLENNTPVDTSSCTKKICTSKETNEKSQNMKQKEIKSANENCTSLHIFKNDIQDILKEKGIDVEIAQDTFNYLQENKTATMQEIVNYIHETIDPDDFNNETTPLKIDTHLNRMFMNDLLEFVGNKYELRQEFIDLAGGEAHVEN